MAWHRLKPCTRRDDNSAMTQPHAASGREAARAAPLEVAVPARSGGLAAALFAALGTVTPLGQWVVGALSMTTALALCAAAVVIALIVVALPWSRWPPRASLAPVIVALVVLGIPLPMPVTGYVVLFPMYLVVFLYVGLTQPPRTAYRLAPLGALSVFLPLVVVDQLLVAVPAAIALAIAVATGEILARHLLANRRAWEVTKGALSGLASLLDSSTLDEARDRLGESLELLLGGAAVTVTLDATADGPPLPSTTSPGGLLALPLRVASGERVQELGVVTIRTPAGHAPRRQREEVAAASILVGEAAKILLRLREAASLADQAGRDPLTGLANRRTFEVETADATVDDVFAMLDLDHFKRVNDALGHAGGDRELVRFAGALVSFARPGDCVARLGGEEFGLLLRAVTPDEAAAWVDRVRTYLRARAVTTFSAGLATHRAADVPAETLARADEAMYAAKRSGRDRTRSAAESAGVAS